MDIYIPSLLDLPRKMAQMNLFPGQKERYRFWDGHVDIGGQGEGGIKSLLLWSVASEIFKVTAQEDFMLHDKETI